MDIVRNVRRQVASFSLATLIASFFAIGVAQAQTFPDVNPGDWFYTYVEDLVAMGVVNGSMPEYRPADNVNRAEMAKLVVEAFDIALEDPATATFKDVPKGEWFFTYVETAAANGIVGGYKDNEGNLTGYYGPGDPLTREQASKMIVLGAPLTTNTNCGPTFPDVGVNRWSYEYVETLYVNSVIDGYPDGTFGPEKNINRAEIAKIVSNGMNPVVRPCGGFNVEDAFATSETTVEVCYNSEYDDTSAMMPENYSILNGAAESLAVNSVASTSDPMCVELTTATQEGGRNYELMVTGVTSADGMDLSIGDASFVGFTGGTGGGLSCNAGDQPAGMSVPLGATGVPFTVVNCTADAPTTLYAMTFHRFGAGDEADIADVYLYEGANRLTTGRSINSETQEVELSGLNKTISGNTSFVVVGDIALGAAPASQHGFELLSKDKIDSNATSISGTFPIQGNLMTISGATAGTVSVEANGSLDELTIGEMGRIAQFELENSGTESAELDRLALYVRGTCGSESVSDFNLFVTGSSEVLASTSGVGAKDLASFALANPFVFSQGESRIFYVEAQNNCRNGETIRTYIDETTDVHVTGTAAGAGFGLLVDIARPLPGNYDGQVAGGGVGDGFSEVTIKGSDFNVAFSGPPAQDIAVGTDDVSCLDLTITNASGGSLELRDWTVDLDIVGGVPTAAGGLLDTTTAPFTPNYTLIKLARMNEDGSVGSSILGPSELSLVGGDAAQTVTLDGSGTVAPNEMIDAAIIFDLNNNPLMNGDKIRCTLNDLTATPDAVRDQNGDALDATSITPSTDIPGNTMTVSSAALDIDVSSTPSSRTYVAGTPNAGLVGFTLSSGTSSGIMLESLTVQGYVDCDLAGVFEADGTANAPACGEAAVSTVLKDVLYSCGLYEGTTLVSDLENINAADGKIIYNNLSVEIPANDNLDLVQQCTVNNSAPYGAANDRVKFAVAAAADVVATQLSNGQNVATGSIDVTGAANGGTADSGVIMTIADSGTGTVSTLSTPQATAVAGATNLSQISKWTFSSVNQDAILNDLQLLVLNDSPASVSSVSLYSGSSCDTLVKTKTPLSNGVVDFPNLGVTIPESTSLTLCAQAMTGTVNNNGVTEPTSASNVGLGLLNVTEVLSGSGDNAAPVYVGTAIGAGLTLATAINSTCTDFTLAAPDPGCGVTVFGGGMAAGDVIHVDSEMMLVGTVAGGEPTLVVRGFANSTAGTHALGSDVTLSTIATLVGPTTVAFVAAGTTATDNGTAFDTITIAGADAAIIVGDPIALPPVTGGDTAVITPGIYRVTAVAGGGTIFTLDSLNAVTTTGTYTSTPSEYTVLPGTTIGDVISGGTNYHLCLVAGCLGVGGGETLQLTAAGTFTPAGVARFPLHGNLHKLFRGIPKVTNSVPGGSAALPPSANTTIHKFKVEAVGDEVRFRNNGGGVGVAVVGGGALAATGANQVVVNLTSSIAIPAAASCTLVRITGGEQNLATVATVADAVAPFVNQIPFTFDLNQLDIAAGSGNAIDVEVRCDSASILALGVGGETLTASLPAAATTVEWGTTVTGSADLVGFGTFIVPVEMTGYTVQKTS